MTTSRTDRSSTVAGMALGAAALLLLTGCQMPPTAGPGGRIPPRQATQAYAEGVLAHEAGDTAKAKERLTTATEIAPELIKARLLLGDLFRAEGDYRAALDQYEAVVRLDPFSPGGFYRLGLAYQFLQRFVEARDAYLTALRLKADDPDSHMNLGLVYLALGELPQAMDHARKATELAPQSPNALTNFGVVLDAVGDLVGAERAFLTALELQGEPPSPATLLNLGQNLLKQNRGREAQEVLTRLTRVADSSLARKRLGDALALQGLAEQAIEQYERALRIDPNYFPALNDAGRVKIQQYRAGLELDESLRQAALAYWNRSLQINPNQPQIQALTRQWTPARP